MFDHDGTMAVDIIRRPVYEDRLVATVITAVSLCTFGAFLLMALR